MMADTFMKACIGIGVLCTAGGLLTLLLFSIQELRVIREEHRERLKRWEEEDEQCKQVENAREDKKRDPLKRR